MKQRKIIQLIITRGKVFSAMDAPKYIIQCITSGYMYSKIYPIKFIPYFYQFCDYIGYEITGLQKHIQLKTQLEHVYKEKEVVTGLIPDLSIAARIMMILDLSGCDISYEIDIDPDIMSIYINDTP